MDKEKIDRLDEIGEEFDCPLLMPPFNGSLNPFYCIKDIKHDAIKFRNFFVQLDEVDIDFRYVEIDGKKDYMEIFS